MEEADEYKNQEGNVPGCRFEGIETGYKWVYSFSVFVEICATATLIVTVRCWAVQKAQIGRENSLIKCNPIVLKSCQFGERSVTVTFVLFVARV